MVPPGDKEGDNRSSTFWMQVIWACRLLCEWDDVWFVLVFSSVSINQECNPRPDLPFEDEHIYTGSSSSSSADVQIVARGPPRSGLLPKMVRPAPRSAVSNVGVEQSIKTCIPPLVVADLRVINGSVVSHRHPKQTYERECDDLADQYLCLR